MFFSSVNSNACYSCKAEAGGQQEDRTPPESQNEGGCLHPGIQFGHLHRKLLTVREMEPCRFPHRITSIMKVTLLLSGDPNPTLQTLSEKM